jgi:membrane-associated phospholipid phosphatase
LNSEGIITFPSLHAALGVLFPAALWRVSGVRWIALGLNSLLLMATPAYGSHYVIDVIAGILVAAACWIAVARILDAASRKQPEPVATIHDPPSIVPEALPPPATVALSRKFESA